MVWAEKKYKNAYRKILTPLKIELRYNAEIAEKKESETLLESKLIQQIESNEDFYEYIESSKSLLSAISIIIPSGNKLQKVLMALTQTKPSHFFMSCICYHSAIMILSEFVHLHRISDKFFLGLMLARKADNHLGIDVNHYLKIIKNLVNHSKINWAIKGIP